MIDNGIIIRKNLKKHFINVILLLSELRIKNIYDISQVQYLILEPNGRFSIIKKFLYRPITPSDMNKNIESKNIPIVIVNDGKLVEGNLDKYGVDKEFLDLYLVKRDIKNIKDVFIATVNKKKESL